MTSQPRPARCVWLTDHDMDWLTAAVTHLRMDEHTHVADIVESIVDRAKDAPADAAEAVANACRAHEYPGGNPGPIGGRGRYSQANAILDALGCPHTEQA